MEQMDWVLDTLSSVHWSVSIAKLAGQDFQTDLKVAWFLDQGHLQYAPSEIELSKLQVQLEEPQEQYGEEHVDMDGRNEDGQHVFGSITFWISQQTAQNTNGPLGVVFHWYISELWCEPHAQACRNFSSIFMGGLCERRLDQGQIDRENIQ